ncbi:hypothetical protein ACHAXA_002844 [Cyclostephanos tholiformis]|uniref:Thioredoxin domain-containing protein n=1 Tax=Cyclostephanos tholiformis TaxID=382380 RepID=A0ABD3RZP3_9STRA
MIIYFTFVLNLYCIAIPFLIDFAGSSTHLVADVDCTANGNALCKQQGIRGYPTIKWGDPSDLRDFQEGQSYDDLKKFADENLKPICSPKNIDLCSNVKKVNILKFQAMSKANLDALIKAEEKKPEDAEKEFKDAVAKLQEQYSALSAKADAKIEAVKGSGLGLTKSVKSMGKPARSNEL